MVYRNTNMYEVNKVQNNDDDDDDADADVCSMPWQPVSLCQRSVHLGV